MEKVDLNRPLRYIHYHHMGIHYSCEVARYGLSTASEFLVIFYDPTRKSNFAHKPYRDGISSLENVPDKKPWTELTQVPLTAWFRRKCSLTEAFKIDSIKIGSGQCYFAHLIEPYNLHGMFQNLEYTLDNPFSKDAIWYFCGVE